MRLTPEQRLLVYEKLLKDVCADPKVDYGMCYYLFNLLDRCKKMPKKWSKLLGTEKMRCLPELNKYKSSSLYWAPRTAEGWETRIGWIEQAIIDVKKKIK